MKVCPVVEGHGEVESVPVLLRRLRPEVEILRPIRVSRDKFINDEFEFSRVVKLAIAKAQPDGHVLVLLDSDDDCPVEVASKLSARLNKSFQGQSVAVVIANREFENWLIAGIDSLGGIRGIPETVESPGDPETIQGAKEWIKKLAGQYSSKIDQPALAHQVGIKQASKSRSFRKFIKEVNALGVG